MHNVDENTIDTKKNLMGNKSSSLARTSQTSNKKKSLTNKLNKRSKTPKLVNQKGMEIIVGNIGAGQGTGINTQQAATKLSFLDCNAVSSIKNIDKNMGNNTYVYPSLNNLGNYGSVTNNTKKALNFIKEIKEHKKVLCSNRDSKEFKEPKQSQNIKKIHSQFHTNQAFSTFDSYEALKQAKLLRSKCSNKKYNCSTNSPNLRPTFNSHTAFSPNSTIAVIRKAPVFLRQNTHHGILLKPKKIIGNSASNKNVIIVAPNSNNNND